jgi:hypothetical protein
VGRRKKGAPTSGAGVSASQKKKKRKEAGRRAAAGTGRWAGGPAGLEREVRSFFSFPFSNSFKIQTFSTQIHSKLFKPFHKIL